MSASARKEFTATLEPLDDGIKAGGLGWVVAWLPFDAAKAWPKLVRTRVVVEVGGEPFRSSLFSARYAVVPEHRRKKGSTGEIPRRNSERGGHFLLVNKKMQAAAGGAGIGASVKFAMWPDLEERKAEIGPELAAILKTEKALAKWYATKLSERARLDIGKWIADVKSVESRLRRAQQVAERLMSTMEAEVELPPAIARRLIGKAKDGWEKMTEQHRRGELMAVFYYQSPEAREKRIAKLADMAKGKA